MRGPIQHLVEKIKQGVEENLTKNQVPHLMNPFSATTNEKGGTNQQSPTSKFLTNFSYSRYLINTSSSCTRLL